MIPRSPLLPIVAGLALLALSACAGTPAQDTGSVAARSGDQVAACRDVADADVQAPGETPLTAVLVSDADTSSEEHDPRATSFDKVLTAARNEQSRLLVDVIGGGVGDAHLAVDTRLVPEGANALQRTQALCDAEDTARAGLQSLLKSQRHSSVDVLGALQVLQGHLTGVDRARTDVVLLGNLVNTTDPVDLGDPAALAAPDVAVDRVTARGLLPDCTGWRVYAVSGSPAGTTSEQDVQLREFWRTFFDRCGGALVVWDRTLTQFPVTGVVVEPVTLSPPPGLPPSVTTPSTTTVTLPETVTFHSGSAELLPAADETLTAVLDAVRAHSNGVIEIIGHTDDVGNETDNDALGLRRAQAIADWLTQHGVDPTRLQPGSVGEREPAVVGTDDQARAANRRVIIIVHHEA